MSGIPMRRVLQEHRRWAITLAVLAAANVAVLLLGVLPLQAAARGAESRAAQVSAQLQQARRESQAAQAMHDARDRAQTELKAFYAEVLPADVAAARRLLQLRLAQLARTHDVSFQRSSATPESVNDSALERLKVTVQLEGDYADIRQFIHELETAKDFVVIDTMVLEEGQDTNAPLGLTLELSTYYLAPRPDAS